MTDFDTLKYSHRLEESGVAPEQAEAHTEALVGALMASLEPLATQEFVELRFVELKASVELRFAQQDANIEQRFAEQNANIVLRFTEQDANIVQRFAEQDARIAQRFTEQQAYIEHRFTETHAEIADLRANVAELGGKVDFLATLMIGALLTFGLPYLMARFDPGKPVFGLFRRKAEG